MDTPARCPRLLVFLAAAALLAPETAVLAARSPKIASGGVRNAADYSANIAPGSMIAIFGTDLAPSTAVASSVPLPIELNGVQVDVYDGTIKRRAAVLFVSANQVNAQIPFDLSHSTIQVSVRRSGDSSNRVSVNLGRNSPAFYTWSGDGKGHAAAIHAADWKIVNRESPADPGEWVILYATGLGPVTHPPSVGLPGGDGGSLGPVNWVKDEVRVTVGGVAAPQAAAVLAPGFVGLYQINVQLPPSLPAGDLPLTVTSGGKTSGPGVVIALSGNAASGDQAEDVLQRALEAQVRGDIDGFLAECATSEYPAGELAGTRELLETVRSNAVLSNFHFEHRATGFSDDGLWAIVRAVVSYDARTADGDHAMTHGVLAFLTRVQNDWKIARVTVDDLLNAELYEASGGNTMKTALVPLPRRARSISLQELNNAIDQALREGHVNGFQLGRSVFFGVVGQVPVVGDAIANINQVIEIGENGWAAAKEAYYYGLGGLAVLKLKQVGVGVVQIVTEPFPWLDAQSDAVQAALEQLSHNLELARNLNAVKSTLAGVPAGDVRLHPWLVPFEPDLVEDPVPGLQLDPIRPLADPSSDPPPLETIRVIDSRAFDYPVPLIAIGEVPFDASSPGVSVIQQLGGEERNGVWYLPVEAGSLVEDDASHGDMILDDYDAIVYNKAISRLLIWRVTCRRGEQELAVRLRNGETTQPVLVVNEVMNKIEMLNLLGTSQDTITVEKGKSVTGLWIQGLGRQLPEESWPDLTNRRECLDIGIGNPEFASLERGTSLTVTGIKPGETTIDALLIGSANAGDTGVTELQESFPLRVIDQPGVLFHRNWTTPFYNGEWRMRVDLTISSPNGSITLVQEGVIGSMSVFSFTSPAGGDFTIAASVSNITRASGDTPAGLVVKGSLVSSNQLTEGTSFERKLKLSPGWGMEEGSVSFAIALYERLASGELRLLAGDNVALVRILPE